MTEPAGYPIDPNPILPALPPDLQPAYYGYGPPMQPGDSWFGPGAPSRNRPAVVIAAAVLGHVVAGLLIVCGALLLIAVWAAHETAGPEQVSQGPTGTLVFACVVDLAAAALLIAGAVLTTARRAAGRLLYTAGAALCLLAGVGWLATTREVAILPVWVLIVAPTAVGLGLVWASAITRWLADAPS